ncbi:MAG TPA: M20/M25/M40 family metallo-hydrolase [Allosphingosinicella sp.]|jgi:acetylornithine deacetylase/succinyl-diaminopimelate desuccinylase-like protein|nr:M20/M25/M40 family metallo-hydrolase [Allosphingosinicella sp.]
MLRRILLAFLAVIAAIPAAAQDAPHQRQARQILERLVSFRTAAGQGQVPPTIAYIQRTLRAGGVADADMVVIPHEETAALLVRVPGSGWAAAPILFSAHMDVVDARPEDWQRSPFALVEENGTFFGRGVLDNKTGVTAMISTILRIRAANHRPATPLVFAFIGDEETTFGTTRLVAAHPWVRGARYAINTDAGGGMIGPGGQPLVYLVQGAEKTFASYRLTITNPGGHSSRPRDDNAIYDLARALLRVEQYRFPVMANALTRQYLGTLGRIVPGAAGAMLTRFAANPQDEEAAEALRRSPEYVGTTRTTCVATMLDAGHAQNALPQRASAVVNCRIFPGIQPETVRLALAAAIGNAAVRVETMGAPELSAVSEPRAEVEAAIAASIHRLYRGVAISPYLESGGTDGLIYRGAGIPTWASSGIFIRPDEMFAHGLNERIPTASFYAAIDHIHDLALALSGGR